MGKEGDAEGGCIMIPQIWQFYFIMLNTVYIHKVIKRSFIQLQKIEGFPTLLGQWWWNNYTPNSQKALKT